jgi:hypothetical protein
MATNKKKDDPIADIKRKLPGAAPWVALCINVIAATITLISHYKKKTDEVFMVPFTHVHYTDISGNYVCGDKYINKQHICDGRFLIVRSEVPTLDEFLKLGLTKEQWDTTQKVLKQFKCEGSNEKGT